MQWWQTQGQPELYTGQPLEAPWTFQEHNHNDWGLFPGAAGYYPPWGTEFGGLNTADHCNMAFNVRPPPDWTGLTPQYDHSPSVLPLPTAAGNTTSCTLENPSVVAQENDTPSLSASSSQTTETAPPTVTRAPAVENHKMLLFQTSPPKTSAAAQTTSLQRQQSVCHNRRQSRQKHQQQSINPTHLPPVPLWNWVCPVTQKTRQSLTSFRAGDKKTALQRTTIRLPHSRHCCHQKQRGRQKVNAKQRRHQRQHWNMQQRQLRYHSRQSRNNIQKRQSIHTGRNPIIITTRRRRRNLRRMMSTPMLWKTKPSQSTTTADQTPQTVGNPPSHLTADTSHTREIVFACVCVCVCVCE